MNRTPSPLRVGEPLSNEAFASLRREMELSHFKWDVQVGDVTALASFPLLMDSATWRALADLAARLAAETRAIENALALRIELHRRLGLPRALRSVFSRGVPTPGAARVMRFDFHFTTDGWRVSEVNSDVPGGFTEATNLARLMSQRVPGSRPAGDPTRALVDAIVRTAGPSGLVLLMNAPGHLEDHQVIAHLAARLQDCGVHTRVTAPGQIRWRDGRAFADVDGTRHADAVVRFYQAEWLAELAPPIEWQPLFVNGKTLVANPGIAALSESKRVPLVWDELNLELPTWKSLLPETRALRDAPWDRDDGWLIKSAYSNTGDTVSIRAAMGRFEWQRRAWQARSHSNAWIAQRRFEVVPVSHLGDRFFPCVGVYTVDGVAAGAYARLSTGPVIDGFARDVALLLSDDP